MAYSNREYVTTTGISTYTFNATFVKTDSRITCIGSGGNGGAKQSNSLGGSGGGAGGCSVIVNSTFFNPGDACSVQVPAANSGSFCMISDVGATQRCKCESGQAGSGASGGIGGTLSQAIGDSKFTGGNGGNLTTGGTGAGGGGAAGINGAGENVAANQQTGGRGDNNTVAAGVPGGNGNNGTEFDATHGSGSGAGGCSTATATVGGNYGGGGGGARGASGTQNFGLGTQGLIIIEWNVPVVVIPDLIMAQMVSRE